MCSLPLGRRLCISAAERSLDALLSLQRVTVEDRAVSERAVSWYKAFSHEPHRRLIEDFLEAIETGREPMSSGRSALAVHQLIDAMLRSAQGTVVEVPRH
jgi:predicted dehydrogenase